MAYTDVTPSTVVRESQGSLTLHIATFAAGTSSTWKSGLPNAVAYWANSDSGQVAVSAIQTSDAASVSFVMIPDYSSVLKLYVLSRT
jgi:hypothetical protein